MDWISLEDELPKGLGLCEDARAILILVNGFPQICVVAPSEQINFIRDMFLYTTQSGFMQDSRFAAPTHWMEIPKPPHVQKKGQKPLIDVSKANQPRKEARGF